MSPRWLPIAIVLALVAGHAASGAPVPAAPGEQSEARDGAGLPPPHAQRSQKRLESPRRDTRRTSHERPPALPGSLEVAPPAIRVAIVEWHAAAPGRGRGLGPRALARAPPGA